MLLNVLDLPDRGELGFQKGIWKSYFGSLMPERAIKGVSREGEL